MKKKNKIWIYSFILAGIALILVNSCKKKDDTPISSGTVPVLTTAEVNQINATVATCGGTITSDGGRTVTARGVCWSTGSTPTIADNKTTIGAGGGSFTSTITGLSPKTTFFVRAYATNTAGTGYGVTMSFTTQQGVTDIDGNVYNTVIIGTQVWMVENLVVSKYRNGDPIPNVTENTAWIDLTTGACCDYENTPANSIIYGKIYNWYAVHDTRRLAPMGWHVSSDEDWTILTTFLGGSDVAGGKMKEAGTLHWSTPNAGADNSSGFTALPGGLRGVDGSFATIGKYSHWWSGNETDVEKAREWSMDYNKTIVNDGSLNKIFGFSVRCVMD